MPVPIPGRLPGVQGREGAAPETFPHASSSPHHPLLLLPGPSAAPSAPPPPSSWRIGSPRGGPQQRPGVGVTCRESFQLLGVPPHPQGRASGRGRLSAPPLPLLALPRRPQLPPPSLRSGPSPRASLGPHRGLIGSANPRPCACSRRHLPLARPAGRASRAPPRPGLRRLRGTRWARRANFPRGAGAVPPQLLVESPAGRAPVSFRGAGLPAGPHEGDISLPF